MLYYNKSIQIHFIIMKTIESIITAILTVSIGNFRFRDIPVGLGVYNVRGGLRAENEKNIYLVDGTKEFQVSEKQLASAWIVPDAKVVKATKYLHEMENCKGSEMLQPVLHKMKEDGKTPSNLLLVCVHTVAKLNREVASDVPVYKPSCYTGHKEYESEMRAIRAEKDEEYFSSKEFGFKFSELIRALHGTAVIPEKAIAKNEEKVPIFTLVSK